MEQTVVPGLTLFISIATVIYTQWAAAKSERRLARIDDRAAAKDVVEGLALLNEAMGRQIEGLQARVEALEEQHTDCNRRVAELTVERLSLMRQITDLQAALREARAQVKATQPPTGPSTP